MDLNAEEDIPSSKLPTLHTHFNEKYFIICLCQASITQPLSTVKVRKSWLRYPIISNILYYSTN